ncbi:hypothetical protein DSO57_1032151 [Entomophthora muscae]|uniref:Uncharacterized protein n=1 Tax=Entomophthora muscae TaxID=34485 RepID=A0ACC2T0W7_9FUNG|nr:hypothetical protein DSO57_1032151 [Entomophthora muscae]
MLPTALMVCQTWVNCNTGKSSYELVYGQKPALVSTSAGPRLSLPKKVPEANEPSVQQARKDQEEMKHKRVEREAIPLQQERFQPGDKIWDVNHDQHKLDPGLCGPGILMEVKPNNTYLIKRIGACTKLKHMHHDCLCLCKAKTAQRNSRLPVPNAKLDQYQACIPNSLKKIPKAPPSSTPGGDVATSLITPSWGINTPSSSPNGSLFVRLSQGASLSISKPFNLFGII